MNPTALVVMFLLLVTSLFSRMLKEYHELGNRESALKKGERLHSRYSPGSKR